MVTEYLVKMMVQSESHSVPTPVRECMKVGRMWHLEAAVGICGSARVHSAADYWTCPVAVPTWIVGEDGLMLVHRDPLVRYTLLDLLLMMTVSRSGIWGIKVVYG